MLPTDRPAVGQQDKQDKQDISPAACLPKYTMQDVHNAIPKHCFKSNTAKSLGLVTRDLAAVFALAAVATRISYVETPAISILSWSVYGFCQGLMFTGLWELAHESGHGALSKHKMLNDAIGLIIHSALLVPFYSWRETHRTHHKGTNHLDRDIAFMPIVDVVGDTDSEPTPTIWDTVHDFCVDCPITALITLFFHQLIAFPIYLILNNFALPRMAKIPWWKRSHFYLGGDGPNFRPEQTKVILISDLALLPTIAVLWFLTRTYGRWPVFLYYGLPYLWANHWILTITLLQHTDLSVPYYSSKSWTFLQGAASTIDRDFGFIGRYLFHGTIENHVVHHHVSHIPCYHAAEATAAIRKVMGSSYHADKQTPYLEAFWKNYRQSGSVDEREPGVYYLKPKYQTLQEI